MEVFVNIITLIAILGLIITIVMLMRMVTKLQAFFMVDKNPYAAKEITKTKVEKKAEIKREKEVIQKTQIHRRFKAMVQSGVGSEEELKEFGTGSNI